MSHSCAGWRGDIGAYLLGALDGDARARVIGHLETCAGCRMDYDDLVPVRGLLSQLAGPGLGRSAPTFRAFDHATGVHGAARLHPAPTGAEIELTVAGLPAGERCVMVAVSARGSDVAGTWSATYDGIARVAGTSAIPVGRLTALRIESGTGRLLLNIPV
jgi:anti-sigma factor RsiW